LHKLQIFFTLTRFLIIPDQSDDNGRCCFFSKPNIASNEEIEHFRLIIGRSERFERVL